MTSVSSHTWEELLIQLDELIRLRVSQSRGLSQDQGIREDISFPPFKTEFISESIGLKLCREEELICLIALLPYLVPGYFEDVVSRIFPDGADLQELGGVKGVNHRGFIPTGETALFLLAGNVLNQRIRAMQYFNPDQPLIRHNILSIESTHDGEPGLSGRIILNHEILEKILFKTVSRPKLSAEFPAQYISTRLDRNSLVISETTQSELETIRNWITSHESMVKEWGLQNKFKAGYRALFYGPPGTGKTFAATLLGKDFDRDVYRIDLSRIVSKYIGETEKNLEAIFSKAENKSWILFFDEADALFGKRTSVSNAHDRYANQETSYLLQRIEDFNGLVILASNNKTNIDTAFLRRFDAIVHFPLPTPEERRRLWQIYLPGKHNLKEDDLDEIIQKYEVTGSTILNAIHNAAINAYPQNRLIHRDDILESLKRELRKEDRMVV